MVQTFFSFERHKTKNTFLALLSRAVSKVIHFEKKVLSVLLLTRKISQIDYTQVDI